MSTHIYIEGGDSREDQIRCREAFRTLIGKLGFAAAKRMPRLFACGGRNGALDDFTTAHANGKPGDFIALLVDSEEPVANPSAPWEHLKARDNWARPPGAEDDQVILMITCMETWIVADRAALKEHHGQKFQENALPPLVNLEQRSRKDVHERLVHATRHCSNAFAKGKRSFEILAKLDPAVLRQHLPSFVRLEWILRAKL